jgi:hypothetical protein
MEMKMYAGDNVSSKEQYLKEGIKYNRMSKKLEKAIMKAEAAFEAKKETLSKEDAKSVGGVIKRLKMAKTEFTKVEETYSTGAGKDIAMKKYKLLRTKYADIFRTTSNLKKVLVTAGLFGVLGTAAYFLAGSIVPEQKLDVPGAPNPLGGSNMLWDKAEDKLNNDDFIGKFLKSVSNGTDGILKNITSFFADNKTGKEPSKISTNTRPFGG